MAPSAELATAASCEARRPAIGFLGVGWIGRHRLQSIVQADAVDVVGVADADLVAASEIAAPLGRAAAVPSLESLLELKPEGVVIATPSAFHAAQTIAALRSGAAVFCQKPLARNAAETARVVQTARGADRLLAVDMSYRFLRGAGILKDLIAAGEIGEIFAVDAVFHNAYGPDKNWYYDADLAGGGCVIDLGIHLVDLALWVLKFPAVLNVSSRLYSRGKPLAKRKNSLEDYAVARLDLDNGATINLACSWRLPAGKDAVIQATFFGVKGGLTLRNVAGSFYDFRTEQLVGTSRRILDEPPDSWGGRAALAWVEHLRRRSGYRSDIETSEKVAEVIDAIYN